MFFVNFKIHLLNWRRTTVIYAVTHVANSCKRWLHSTPCPEEQTSSEGCVAAVIVITTFTNWNLNVILPSCSTAAFCSFTVPLNQTISWLHLWWRAEVIFSSRLPVLLMWGTSPTQGRVTHFPSPCTHTWHWGLHFQRHLDCSCSFWWEMQLGAAAEHCWAPGAQGSSQAQTGREQSLENVPGCPLSCWHFTQSPAALCGCLSVCPGNPAVVASHGCRTCALMTSVEESL